MNHQQATHSHCTERYLLGEMNDQERFDFEEHFFDCPECADDVKAAVAFTDNARQVLTEDPQLDALGPESLNRSSAAPDSTPSSFSAPISPPRASTVQAFRIGRFQIPPMLLAAAMVLVLCGASFQTLFVIPNLQQQLAEASTPQAVSWEFLSVSRSTAPVISLSKDHRWMGFRLSKSSDRPFAYYRCELRNSEDQVVQSAVIPSPPDGEELGLVLPGADLSAGAYIVVLSGLDTPSGPIAAAEISRYPFTLELAD